MLILEHLLTLYFAVLCHCYLTLLVVIDVLSVGAPVLGLYLSYTLDCSEENLAWFLALMAPNTKYPTPDPVQNNKVVVTDT